MLTQDSHAVRPSVLLLDDDPIILRTFARLFQNSRIHVQTAINASTARAALERHPFQVVVSDHTLPCTTGTAFLQEVRNRWPDRIRILLTGEPGLHVAVEAINQAEIFRLVPKPWGNQELLDIIEQALDAYVLGKELEARTYQSQEQCRGLSEANAELRRLNQELGAGASRRKAELSEMRRELKATQLGTIRALAEAVDAHDPYTRGHSERVGIYASRIARELKCENEFIEQIYVAGLLHDVGKIGIPSPLITKPGPLTEEEFARVRQHAEIGARILSPVPFLREVVPCVRHHHEWYDGSSNGYPAQLAGNEIPLPSRIILVADTVEAMTSDRPYRKALPLWRAIEEVRNFRGTQFDPVMADAFLRIVEREGERFLEQANRFDIDEFLSEGEFGA